MTPTHRTAEGALVTVVDAAVLGRGWASVVYADDVAACQRWGMPVAGVPESRVRADLLTPLTW